MSISDSSSVRRPASLSIATRGREGQGSAVLRIANYPKTCAIVAFIVLLFVCGRLAGPTTCRSGWQSPSIGSRGACAHHGGVDRTKFSIIFFVSAAGAIGIWWLLARRNQRLAESEAIAAHLAWKENFLASKHTSADSPDASIVSPDRIATELAIANSEPATIRKSVTGKLCLSCGASMLSVIAADGPIRGLHWRCERYPRCDWMELIEVPSKASGRGKGRGFRAKS